jgi:hypothetical protein
VAQLIPEIAGLGLAVALTSPALSYALSLAAGAEILKADVSTPDAVAAAIVFAVTSVLTVAAPVVVACQLALDRARRVDGDRRRASRTRCLRPRSPGMS